MKMEHAVTASAAGVVTHVHVVMGQQVDQGTTLAVVDDAMDGLDGLGATDEDETMEETTP